MLIVVGLMAIGVVLGYLLRNRTRLVKTNEILIKWAIYILLFLLGIAIGNNNSIMENLHSLGLKALAISAGAVMGSVLLAWVTYNKLFKNKDQ